MDKTEAMIIEIEKNQVLYSKSNKDYKDITISVLFANIVSN